MAGEIARIVAIGDRRGGSNRLAIPVGPDGCLAAIRPFCKYNRTAVERLWWVTTFVCVERGELGGGLNLQKISMDDTGTLEEARVFTEIDNPTSNRGRASLPQSLNQ